jgi:hypothetical protein
MNAQRIKWKSWWNCTKMPEIFGPNEFGHNQIRIWIY